MSDPLSSIHLDDTGLLVCHPDLPILASLGIHFATMQQLFDLERFEVTKRLLGIPSSSEVAAATMPGEAMMETDAKSCPSRIEVVIGTPEQVSAATENQKSLFEWLDPNQEAVLSGLRPALVDYYCSQRAVFEEYVSSEIGQPVFFGERPYLPRIDSGTELDDLVRINTIYLHPHHLRVSLVLECPWLASYSEGGWALGAVFRDFQLEEIGIDDIAWDE